MPNLPSASAILAKPGTSAPPAGPGTIPDAASVISGPGSSGIPDASAVLGTPGLTHPAAPTIPSHGLWGDITNAVGQIGHYAAKTGEGLAQDAYNVPGGLFQLGKGVAQDTEALSAKLGLHSATTDAALKADPTGYGNIEAFGKGTVQSVIHSFEHPGAHPDQTLLNALMLGSMGFGGFARLGAATDAVNAGGGVTGGVKALATKAPAAPRIIQARPSVADQLAMTKTALAQQDLSPAEEAALNAHLDHLNTLDPTAPAVHVPLVPSGNHMINALLRLHDRLAVQKPLLEKPNSSLALRNLLPGSDTGFGLGSYAAKRVGSSLEETARRDTAMAAAPATRLGSEGGKLGGRVRGALSGSRNVQQAALRLTAEQALPEERIATHEAQIQAIADNHAALASGQLTPEEQVARVKALQALGPVENHAQQVKLLRGVQEKGLVEATPEGHVVVNAALHPKLAKADARLAAAGATGEGILGALDRAKAAEPYIDRSGEVVHPEPDEVAARIEQMQASRLARIDAPNRVHAGATFETRTPGKEGVVPPALERRRAEVAQVQSKYDELAAKTRAAGVKAVGEEGMIGNKIAGEAPRQRSAAASATGVSKPVTRTRVVPRTVGDVQARHDQLAASIEDLRQAVMDKMLSPKRTLNEDEQLEQKSINQQRGKFDRQQAGLTPTGMKAKKLDEAIASETAKLADLKARATAGDAKAPALVTKSEQRLAKMQAERHGLQGKPFQAGAKGTNKVLNRPATINETEAPEANRIIDQVLEEHKDAPWTQSYHRAVAELAQLKAALEAHTLPEWAREPMDEPAPPFGTKNVTETVPFSKKGTIPAGGRVISPAPGARLERMGGHLSSLKDKLAQEEAAFERRQKPTGLLGGEGARPGRQHVAYYSSESAGAPPQVSRPVSGIAGKAAEAVGSKEFTGQSIQQGRVPDNTTGIVARHLNRLVKELSTIRHRNGLPGSPTRLTMRDMLVNEQEIRNATVPEELKAQLTGKRITLDELAGEHQAFEAFRQMLVPGLAPKTDELGNPTVASLLPHDAPIGTPAPTGYKWVDRNMMGALGRPQIPLAGAFAKRVDSVNAAVTAATVYYKLGHVATRFGTDAMTNLIEGSLRPSAMRAAYNVWDYLDEAQRDQAIAGVGGGGFAAMPQLGESVAARVAHTGSAFWARKADAPSRFLNLHYIAAKSGFGSPEKFAAFLRESLPENRASLTDRQWATIDGIWKRAERASIQYDKLSDFERQYLNRAVWFWPWLKGSTKFAGRTIIEHPVQAAAVGALGERGREQALADLGPQPSYNAGIFKIGGSSDMPWTMNLNTVSPLATPASLAEDAIHINRPTQAQQLAGSLSPIYAAGGGAIYHLNQFGTASKKGILNNFVSQLVGTTPEAALYKALTGQSGAQGRQFPTTPLEGILRFLGGSEVPRVQNRGIANAAAVKEKTAAGRR